MEMAVVTIRTLNHVQIIFTQFQSDHYCYHTTLSSFTGLMSLLPPSQQLHNTEA